MDNNLPNYCSKVVIFKKIKKYSKIGQDRPEGDHIVHGSLS